MLILPIGVLAVLFVMSSVPGGSRPAGGRCDTLLPVSAVRAEKKGNGPQGGLGRGRGLRYGCRRGGYLCLKESSFVDGGGMSRMPMILGWMKKQ